MIKDAKLILIPIAALFLACVFLTSISSADGGIIFHCSMDLHGQVIAKGEFRVSDDGSSLQYKLTAHNVEDINMAHLHLGKVGKIGTPIVWLYPAGPPPKLIPGLFDGILAKGTITGANLIGPMRGSPLSLLIAEMRAGNVYVNIHTKTHAHGDICGVVSLTED